MQIYIESIITNNYRTYGKYLIIIFYIGDKEIKTRIKL